MHAKRMEFGYTYRGYYIERCPANQWNIYQIPTGEPNWSELFLTGLESVDEGIRSLKEAKTEIDSYLDGK